TDRQLARVRLVARRGGARLGRSQLKPHGFNRALELGHARGRRNLARTCRLETRLGAGNGRAQRLVAPRDLHLLPLPQLFAELPVPPRTRRLALQRVPLLLDLVDHVVDAREVLLRRLELQLGRPTSRLGLRDAGGFLDKRAPLGRTRRKDLPDLSLLDDGVGLHAEARVHQQIVDVAQAAHLAVDQVLAFTRPVQPAADLDVARDDGLILEERIAVAAVGFARPHRTPHLRELEPHLGRRRRLARLAPAEDHVFYALAA